MLYFSYITETFHEIFPKIIHVIFLWNISCCVGTRCHFAVFIGFVITRPIFNICAFLLIRSGSRMFSWTLLIRFDRQGALPAPRDSSHVSIMLERSKRRSSRVTILALSHLRRSGAAIVQWRRSRRALLSRALATLSSIASSLRGLNVVSISSSSPSLSFQQSLALWKR